MMPNFRRGQRESIAKVVELLREIGTAHTTGPTQVALRWLIENDTVLPIPGAKNEAQARVNAEALTFSLSADEVGALAQATTAWRT